MPLIAKVSIRLPDEVLQAVEVRRRQSGEARSGFVRRAVEALLRQDRERDAVDRYVAGYLADPESADETAWADLGADRLAQVAPPSS